MNMLKLIMIGLLLGWGVAIPIGAVNLEIIRRNLHYGTKTGMVLGLGACLADLTYLLLVSLGVLHFLSNPGFLKVTGVLGSFILAFFGWMAIKQKTNELENSRDIYNRKTTATHLRDGYLLTLINPYNIVFWSSISVTIASNSITPVSTFYTGLGVMLGTLSWIIGLNTLLHYTKHRISPHVMRYINITGGLILIAFACVGLSRAIFY